MLTREKQLANGHVKPVSIRENDDFSDVPLIGEKPSLRDQARIDYTRELPPPETVLKVNDEIFGTLGNFSLVIGKAKSRKTFLMALVLAACIGINSGASIFEGMLPPGKSHVVFVDTEQGEYHVVKVAQRATRLTGKPEPENFEVYALRKFSTDERNIILDEIINTTPDLGLLVIDGVRDIVTSINDEEQATELANKLLKWTEEKQIHIVTVLHQNKGDFNARGHVGTELINKAETTVSVTVEKDKEVSKVEVEYSRNKEFEPFAFRVNDVGLPEVLDGWQPKDEISKNEKYEPFEVDEYKHIQILQRVSRNVDKPNYSELYRQVKSAVGLEVQKVGINKAKDFCTYYLNQGFITRHGKERSPKSYYTIHPNGKNHV